MPTQDKRECSGHENQSYQPERRIEVTLDQSQQDRKQEIHHARRRYCSAGIEVDHRGLQLFGAADKRSRSNIGESDNHVKQCDPNETHHGAAGAGSQMFARDLGN